MGFQDELEGFSDYIDGVAEDLDEQVGEHFDAVRGHNAEDEDLFELLVVSGLLLVLARMPIDGVVRRTARLLRAKGYKAVTDEALAVAVQEDRSRMVAYMRAEARAGFEQARARMLQGMTMGGTVEGDVLEQARQVFVDYMHSKVSVAVMVWQRIVVQIAAQTILGGEDWLWEYVGVRDTRNRPFCASVLDMNRVFDNEQVVELNKHPDLQKHVPPNVRELCGGYGCRHIFLPISRREAGARYKPGPLWPR